MVCPPGATVLLTILCDFFSSSLRGEHLAITFASSFELTHLFEGNNKGTLSAKHHRKPSTKTREQARRINNLALVTVTGDWRSNEWLEVEVARIKDNLLLARAEQGLASVIPGAECSK